MTASGSDPAALDRAGGADGDDARLRRFVTALPKAEIHVHLEGAIRPSTLLALAAKHGIDLPADDEAGLAEWFTFRDFEHFVEVYVTCSRCLIEPEDFHRLTLDFLEEQARQGVLWSEAHFSISTHLAAAAEAGRPDPGQAIRQAIQEAGEVGERRFGTRLALIPDIVRNQDIERADRTVEWILADRPPGAPFQPGGAPVVALGLGGIEEGYPPEPFARHFEEVARAGFRRVAHAGEHGGPESVRAALDVLGAERIGHGVRAAEDPELVEELARRGTPLEVCPSSNVCLGLFDDVASHPFHLLREAGVDVSLGSDDPPFFSTTLVDEYLRTARAFGYGPEELAGIARRGIAACFLPEDEKAALDADLVRRAAEAGEEIYGRAVRPAPPPVPRAER